MGRKRALITGISGQDGSYLAEYLLAKDYKVVGVVRRASTFNFGRIDALFRKYGRDQLEGVYGDLGESSSIRNILAKVEPDEIYNLAAQSHVGISFEIPEYTADITGVGVVRLLEAVRTIVPSSRFYQASSSELYGDVLDVPQTEKTPFNPVSPYACAKAYAFYITKAYRTAYNLYTANGILFNHESPRRGENFLSRKATSQLAAISLGLASCLEVGNLEAKRDWGYAPDYVECIWRMLQQEKADDYVIASGESRSVREFIELAARKIGFDLEWRGRGLDEVGIDLKTGRTIIKVNQRYFRPAEVNQLCGDPSKAVRELGWNPRKTSFDQLVSCMVNHDLQLCEALVRMKERWPNLPIDSFKSAFLREADLQSEVDPRYKVESISRKE
jgi:GDPmannose 4,6-dehydratase